MDAITWIKDNWIELMALWGAIYTVALFVVKLTPTPKDNDALDKVNGFVRGLCKFFGLDVKQGVESKVNNRPRPTAGTYMLLVACLLSLSVGCGTIRETAEAIHSDPLAEVIAAQELVTAAINSMAALDEQGAFSDETEDQITMAIDAANKYIAEWTRDAVDGHARPDGMVRVRELVANIYSYKNGG